MAAQQWAEQHDQDGAQDGRDDKCAGASPKSQSLIDAGH
jgi:hypothetical protein